MDDFFLLVNHGVGDQNEEDAVHHPDGLPAFAAFNDPILAANVQGIEKNPRGRIEADAMLPLVAAALLVPAKSHLYIQYCIYEPWVITKTSADKLPLFISPAGPATMPLYWIWKTLEVTLTLAASRMV